MRVVFANLAPQFPAVILASSISAFARSWRPFPDLPRARVQFGDRLPAVAISVGIAENTAFASSPRPVSSAPVAPVVVRIVSIASSNCPPTSRSRPRPPRSGPSAPPPARPRPSTSSRRRRSGSTRPSIAPSPGPYPARPASPGSQHTRVPSFDSSITHPEPFTQSRSPQTVET